MRKTIIAGNWKMNKNVTESVDFVSNLPNSIKNEKQVEMIICAPFISLDRINASLEGSNIKLGAQNMYWENSGAFTGEVSASMLKSVGCTHVIIGHSERRQYFGENDISVNSKVKKALEQGLKPIFCVGETLAEREAGKTDQLITDQVETGLNGIKINQGNAEELIIAYEPVWAIGTGKTCDTAEANRVIVMIRNILSKQYGSDVSSRVRILYGGSAKPENIRELISAGNIDGGLIGGASLDPTSFAKLVQNVL